LLEFWPLGSARKAVFRSKIAEKKGDFSFTMYCMECVGKTSKNKIKKIKTHSSNLTLERPELDNFYFSDAYLEPCNFFFEGSVFAEIFAAFS
jgi:hypothetical protein